MPQAKQQNSVATEPSKELAIFPDQFGQQVAAPSTFVQELRMFWSQVDCLWLGTVGMRAAGKTYLPQEPAELDADYLRRLTRTTLHNFYKRAVLNASARVFTRDPLLKDAGLPIQTFVTDVDNQGRNLAQFSKSCFEDALNHGISYILVDYSRLPIDYSNLAEERAAGNRPYWVSIGANAVLDARSANFGGGERLSYFRYEETVTELASDLVNSVTHRQVRIFKQFPRGSELPDGSIAATDSPIYFAIYRLDEKQKQWFLFDSGIVSGASVIPVVPIYANRVGFFMGKPPLQDLAELNIQHWQNTSDYQNILHVVTVPILFVKGLTPELDENGNKKQVTISPHSAVISTNPEADIKYVEHTGSAVATARIQLQDLESRMEALGVVLTSSQPGGVTATHDAISAAEQNSILKSMALGLQDSLNMAIWLTSEFMAQNTAATVLVNTDYAVDYASDTTMSNVVDMFDSKIITSKQVIAEAQRRNILDPTAVISPVGEPTTPPVEL